MGGTACILVALATAGGACDRLDENGLGAVVEDASADVRAVAVCPDEAPFGGEPCTAPEGTTCDFGACDARLVQCLGGFWRYGKNPETAIPCPKDPPEPDAACPICWLPATLCRYGSEDCSLPDASRKRAVASCPAGVWEVAIAPCSDASAAEDAAEDAGSSDADDGADVQGDAGLDGD